MSAAKRKPRVNYTEEAAEDGEETEVDQVVQPQKKKRRRKGTDEREEGEDGYAGFVDIDEFSEAEGSAKKDRFSKEDKGKGRDVFVVEGQEEQKDSDADEPEPTTTTTKGGASTTSSNGKGVSRRRKSGIEAGDEKKEGDEENGRDDASNGGEGGGGSAPDDNDGYDYIKLEPFVKEVWKVWKGAKWATEEGVRSFEDFMRKLKLNDKAHGIILAYEDAKASRPKRSKDRLGTKEATDALRWGRLLEREWLQLQGLMEGRLGKEDMEMFDWEVARRLAREGPEEKIWREKEGSERGEDKREAVGLETELVELREALLVKAKRKSNPEEISVTNAMMETYTNIVKSHGLEMKPQGWQHHYDFDVLGDPLKLSNTSYSPKRIEETETAELVMARVGAPWAAVTVETAETKATLENTKRMKNKYRSEPERPVDPTQEWSSLRGGVTSMRDLERTDPRKTLKAEMENFLVNLWNFQLDVVSPVKQPELSYPSPSSKANSSPLSSIASNSNITSNVAPNSNVALNLASTSNVASTSHVTSSVAPPSSLASSSSVDPATGIPVTADNNAIDDEEMEDNSSIVPETAHSSSTAGVHEPREKSSSKPDDDDDEGTSTFSIDGDISLPKGTMGTRRTYSAGPTFFYGPEKTVREARNSAMHGKSDPCVRRLLEVMMMVWKRERGSEWRWEGEGVGSEVPLLIGVQELFALTKKESEERMRHLAEEADVQLLPVSKNKEEEDRRIAGLVKIAVGSWSNGAAGVVGTTGIYLSNEEMTPFEVNRLDDFSIISLRGETSLNKVLEPNNSIIGVNEYAAFVDPFGGSYTSLHAEGFNLGFTSTMIYGGEDGSGAKIWFGLGPRGMKNLTEDLRTLKGAMASDASLEQYHDLEDADTFGEGAFKAVEINEDESPCEEVWDHRRSVVAPFDLPGAESRRWKSIAQEPGTSIVTKACVPHIVWNGHQTFAIARNSLELIDSRNLINDGTLKCECAFGPKASEQELKVLPLRPFVME